MNETDQIEMILDLPHPPERVWTAVSTAEGLSGWFSDRVTMTPEVGEEILFEWDAYGAGGGRVESVEPLRRFAYRWRANGVPESEPMSVQNSTLVTFELSPTANGTRLRVVETGFANLPSHLRETAFRENTSGWTSELAELETYLQEQPA